MVRIIKSMIERILYLLQRYGVSYLKGAGTTLAIALVSTAIGCLIGFVVGVVQTIPVDKKRDSAAKRGLLRVVKIILKAYVELFRGTPMIVQAVFIYYGLSQVFNIQLGMWSAAFLVVSINTGAYMAESVRGGIISVDPGQMEGAKAIGMTHVQAMKNVILPQAIRNIMPQIGNNLIINIKDSSVLSVIGVIELYYAAKQTAGAYYWWFEAMTVAMVLYLIMTFVFSRLLRFWESKLDGPASFDLATTDQLAHTSGNYSYPGEGSFDKERNIETDVNGGRDK